MEQQRPVKKSYPLAEAFIAWAVYMGLFYAMQMLPGAALLLGVPCIFIGARRGVWAWALLFAVSTACTFLLSAPTALLAGAVQLLPGLVCTICLRRKVAPWYSLLATGIAALVTVLAGVLVLGRMAEGSIAEFLVNTLLNAAAEDAALAETLAVLLVSEELLSGTMSAASAMELLAGADLMPYLLADTSVAALQRITETAVPEFLVQYLAFGSAAGYYFPGLLANKLGSSLPLRPVEEWVVPRQHGYYLCFTFVLGYLGMALGGETLQAPASMLFSLMSIILGIVGGSVLTHFLKVGIKAKAGRVAIAVGAYLLLPGLLTVIGCVEQLISLRSLFVFIRHDK